MDIGLRDGGNVIAAITEDRVLDPGAEIGLSFDAGQAHLFPDEEVARAAH